MAATGARVSLRANEGSPRCPPCPCDGGASANRMPASRTATSPQRTNERRLLRRHGVEARVVSSVQGKTRQREGLRPGAQG
jgi:hypothetical protein